MSATSGTAGPAKLDERSLRNIFDDAVKRSGAFGAQLSIIKGLEQLDFAAGFAHVKRDLPMTRHTLMKIGSVSKVFNSLILVSLVEEGRVDLDASVVEYLPEFEVADAEATRTLTLRQLISMSSGLDNGPYDHFGGGDDALGRYVAGLSSLPQHFPPGKYFGYSNAGTCIAGFVASRITGKSWEELLREKILQPAALTRAAALEADVLYQTVSAGHELLSDGTLIVTDPTITMARCLAPSGDSLASCAGELARLGMIFVRKGRVESGERILAESSIDWMQAEQIGVPIGLPGTSYCMGFATGLWNGVRVFGKAGGTSTSCSYLYWIPEQNGSVAFIVNTNSAMGKFSAAIFEEVLSAAFGFSKPRIDGPTNLAPPIPHRYVGIYQEAGATMVVSTDESNTLNIRYIPNTKMYGIQQEATLCPLGSDRFTFSQPCGAGVGQMIVETAFFGEDRFGRATNMLNGGGFPMRRIV